MAVKRIGVFFDGTGNNMWNDMAINDGSFSNVAKLYQLYDNPSTGDEAFYAEGVGTEAYTQSHIFSDAEIEKIRDKKLTKNDIYIESGGLLGLTTGYGMKDLVNKKLAEVQIYING